MRPNVQFFDDFYDETFFKNSTAKRIIEEADCLIVVGTKLNTSTHLIVHYLQKDPPQPVIEINEKMAVKAGFNLHI